MQKILSLFFMLLLAVAVSGCGGRVARPDRCSCEHSDITVAKPVETAIGFENLLKGTLFDFDSDKIKYKNYMEQLNVVAKFLKDNPNVSVTVEGHTDNTGPKEYNQRLSERRAGTIANYLISKGVGKSQVSTKGFGFSKPVASNDTPQGRAQNRRTELKFAIND